MKNPFQWFDDVHVISHPCTGRQGAIVEELSTVGIYCPKLYYADADPSLKISNMRRNPAVEFACSLSHIKALVGATRGARRELFVEDDIVFLESAEERMGQAIDEIPPIWSILYLGGHPREPVERYSEHLVRVKTFSFAEAYAINGPWLQSFLNFWCDRVSFPNAMFDFILGEWAASTGLGYAIYPGVTEQPPNFSHIGNKDDDKRELVRRGWANNI